MFIKPTKNLKFKNTFIQAKSICFRRCKKFIEWFQTCGEKNKIIYCKLCVIPSSKPNIGFTKEGICDACLFHRKK